MISTISNEMALVIGIFIISQVKIAKTFQRKIVNIFLPIIFGICFGCSKELSHRDSSFEYPQHMFWCLNKKIIFLVHTLTKGLSYVQNYCRPVSY